MRIVIREKVYETNSSSVHTLVYNPKHMEKNRLTVKNGYVQADFGQFGTEECIYKSQDAKLSYLLSELYYINHYSTDIEKMYEFENIEKAIHEFDSSVIGIKVLNKIEPEIDHQSQPEYGESNFVKYWDKDSIKAFLFNDDIWIKTDCD